MPDGYRDEREVRCSGHRVGEAVGRYVPVLSIAVHWYTTSWWDVGLELDAVDAWRQWPEEGLHSWDKAILIVRLAPNFSRVNLFDGDGQILVWSSRRLAVKDRQLASHSTCFCLQAPRSDQTKAGGSTPLAEHRTGH